jgi:uncharacterized protein (DUF433 family)
MGHDIHPDHAFLDQPLYGYAEAARLARVPTSTAKRWIAGYSYVRPTGEEVARPPVTPRAGDGALEGVSYLDLVELAAIGRLKSLDFSLAKIRTIVATCRDLLGVPHPLASEVFKVGGRDIFVQRDGALVDVLRRRGAQAWYEVLDPFLETLDYQDQLAHRWWPLGKDKPVVIDPEYAFGLPVVDGTGVRTEILFERFAAGELAEEIAQDFRLDVVQVERALQFESERRAA